MGIKKYEDTANNLWKQNILSTDRGLITSFFDLIDMRKTRLRNYVTGQWLHIIKSDK